MGSGPSRGVMNNMMLLDIRYNNMYGWYCQLFSRSLNTFFSGGGGDRTTPGLMTYITFHAPRHKKTGIYLYIVLGGRDLNGFKDIEDFLF